MTIPLITGQFDISQGGINNLVNQINIALGGIISFSNLSGAITSVGPVTSLGSFSSLQLKNALTDETGSGPAVFATSPALVTPNLGTPTALIGTNITGIASGLTSGSVTGLSVVGGKTLTASNTLTLTGTDSTSINLTNAKVRTIGFSVSSAALTTGQQGGYVVVPVSGNITGWTIMANAGTATVQTWKIAAGTAVPTGANSISTSGVSLATGTAIQSTTISDFTSTTVTAGDMFAFNLSAVSGVTTLEFQLQITVV